MIRKIKSKLDVHTFEVLMKSSKTLLVRISSMILSVVISIFLGNTIGANGLGIINLVNQLMSLILVFSFLGMGQIIIKEVAIAYESNYWDKISDIFYSAFFLNGALTFVISVVLVLCSPWISEFIFNQPDLTFPLCIASIVLTPQIFSRIFSSCLIGYKKIWQSQLVDQALSVFFVTFSLLVLWFFGVEITVNIVALIYALGRGFVTIVIGIYWRKISKIKFTNNYIGKSLMISGLPLLIVNASLLLSQNADMIMLGVLSNIKDVGLYSIASKLALLTSFILQISISTIGPKIAVLYNSGKLNELEKMVQQVSKYLVVIGLVFLVFFITVGKNLLNFWGDEFREAYSILIILSVGQFFNIASGPVGNILIMTNHSNIIRNITILTVTLNMILNYFFIINFGANGAAIATTITIILNMSLSYFYVSKKLKINMINFRTK